MTKNELREWYQSMYPGQNASFYTMQQLYNNAKNVPTAVTNNLPIPTVNAALPKGGIALPDSIVTNNLPTSAGNAAKQFGWGKGSGLTAFGKNIGKVANIGSGIMYGLEAINNAKNVSDAQADSKDLMTDILRSSASNPLTASFLTSDQNAMLNKIKRGKYNSEAGFGDIDLMSLLGGAGKGALTGALFGGIPGAVIGGLGGGLNANLTRQGEDQQRINSELEGLYQSLIDAENKYNAMKRPPITGLGLQSRYQNMFM